MYIDELNQSGGVNGRQVELVVKNDSGEPEQALQAIEGLHSQGIDIIIGPALSSQVSYVLDYLNSNAVLAMGATITSPKLSGRQDYFLRVSQDNTRESILQANFLLERGKTEVIAVLDTANTAFTLPWFDEFRATYSAGGGRVVAQQAYKSQPPLNHARTVRAVRENPGAAVLTVASASDTAQLLQRLRRNGLSPVTTTSGWAQTDTLIQLGANAVEGVYTSHIAADSNRSQKARNFADDYRARYGESPNFAAFYNYDAIHVLVQAMDSLETIDADSVKQQILQQQRFDSVYDSLQFDRYGDVTREYVMLQVTGGEFTRVKEQ